MRFHDILTLLTFCGPAIVFINGLGIFAHNYYAPPDTATFELSEMSTMATQSNIGLLDYFGLAVSQVLSGLGWIKDLIVTIVYVYPSMVQILHVPPILAGFLQVAVVLSIVTFSIQVATKFGWGQMK